MTKKLLILFFNILFFINVSAVLAETSLSEEWPTLNRSIRALGMGNAFIASDGNEYSPFYNPAGLNDIEEGRLKFLSPTIDFSLGSLKLVNDAIDLKKNLGNSENTADKIRVLDQFVQKNMGDFKHVRYEMDIASYVTKNFAIGMIIDERLDFSFRDQSFTNFDARNIGDAAVYISGAFGVMEKFLQFGATVRPTVRFAMNDKITYNTVIGAGSSSWGDLLKSAYKDYKIDVSGDFGFKSNLNIPGLQKNEKFQAFQKTMRPSIAITWQDIGNPFPTTKTTDAGDVVGFVKNEQSVNLGFAVHPAIGFLNCTFEADFIKLNQTGSFLHRFNIGGEFKFPHILSVRSGFNQGYIAAGVSFDFKILVIDFATYAEETGIYGSRMGDRRIAATINFGI